MASRKPVNEKRLDLSRDYKILFPIATLALAILAVILPNMENYLIMIFTFCSGLIGLYGGLRGKGTKLKDVREGNVENDNTFGIHPGLVRLVCGVICVVYGMILASFLAPATVVFFIFGMGGEFVGISLPGLVNN